MSPTEPHSDLSPAQQPVDSWPEHGPPPDGSAIPFDIECPTCRHDLSGAPAAACEACGRTLDWDWLIPWQQLRCPKCRYPARGITSHRCPECGEEWDWNRILASARNRIGGHLEHFWFDSPLSAFLSDLTATVFTPTRFWKRLDRGDPPRIRPLSVLLILEMLMILHGWSWAGLFADVLMDQLSGLTGSRASFTYAPRPQWPLPSLAVLALTITLLGTVRLIRRRGLADESAHAIRIMTYSTLALALAMPTWCLAEMCIDLSYLIHPGVNVRQEIYNAAGIPIWGLALLTLLRNLIAAFRHYLELPGGRMWALICWLGGIGGTILVGLLRYAEVI